MNRKSYMAEQKNKFLVDQERNLIVPFKTARRMLDELRLPVYKGDVPRTYKCHIAHVLKRLTYLALEAARPGFDPYGIELRHLKAQQRRWEYRYPELAQ